MSEVILQKTGDLTQHARQLSQDEACRRVLANPADAQGNLARPWAM